MLLAACTPGSDLYARVDDGRLQFLVCEDVEPEAIEVTIAPAGTGDWSSAWSAEGPAEASFGRVITYGIAPSGWRTVSGPTTIDPAAIDAGITLWVGSEPVGSNSVHRARIEAGGWQGGPNAPAPSAECLAAAEEVG